MKVVLVGRVYNSLLLLVAAGLLSNASGLFQQGCRTCTNIPANCTENTEGIFTTRHCSVNVSSCGFVECDSEDVFCSNRWFQSGGNGTDDGDSGSDTTLMDLGWEFSSGCTKTGDSSQCSEPMVVGHEIQTLCRIETSSLNCCDNKTDILMANFTLLIPIETRPTTVSTTTVPVTTTSRDYTPTYAAIGSVLGIALLVVVFLFVSFCLYKWRSKICSAFKQTTPSVMTRQTDFTEPPDPLSWQLLERIGHGRYGYVYRADYQGEIVAVKLYAAAHGRSAFESEQTLYSMESTAHENILEYIASEVRGSGSTLERALLTRYYPLGSLDKYLRSHTVSWPVACSIILAVSRGLAHLHSEYYHHSSGIVSEKYPVAHRDIKSANVLVRSESGDCVISDLGFALILDGKQTNNTIQAGTYRYMAPEALDARVNLQDLQSFKQIDVYGLALVMWEVMSRTCIITEDEVPAYQLPYTAEAGPRVTLEGLKDIVVTRKLRPSLPAIWANHETLNSLQEMLTDCWDGDAEARLSAANVALRMEQYITTNINDLSRQDSNHSKTVATAVPTAMMDVSRPAEHSQSSPPPYYSPTDPIPFQQQSDVSRRDSTVTTATNASQSVAVDMEKPTEHSQSGPPPYSEPAEDYVPFRQNQPSFTRGPILAQQSHQVSMPHIFSSESEQGRSPRGHMAARCTHSLRSNYQYEAEMKQLKKTNKSESLSLRNMTATTAQTSVEIEENIRELSHSPFSSTIDERGLDVDDVASSNHVSLGGHNNVSASSLNSDSGFANTHSDLSHSDTIPGHYATESDQDQETLASFVEDGVITRDQNLMVEGTMNSVENSGSTVTSI